MTSEGRMQKHNAIGKQKLFFGGIPTEPDITALKESFPASTLKPGVLVSYHDIEKVIRCAIRSNRFRTVVNRGAKSSKRMAGLSLAVKMAWAYWCCRIPASWTMPGTNSVRRRVWRVVHPE